MDLKFQDIYGQFINIHDHTASGNVRLCVRTMPDMNDIPGKKIEEMEIETDISVAKQEEPIYTAKCEAWRQYNPFSLLIMPLHHHSARHYSFVTPTGTRRASLPHYFPADDFKTNGHSFRIVICLWPS